MEALQHVEHEQVAADLIGQPSKLRFLGLTGLLFPFTLATGGGFALKVALLTFGMTTFLVTSLARS